MTRSLIDNGDGTFTLREDKELKPEDLQKRLDFLYRQKVKTQLMINRIEALGFTRTQ